MIPLEEVPCPGCGGTEGLRLKPVMGEPPAPAGPWTLCRCAGCESAWLSPRPADPAALYGESYHVYGVPGRLARLPLRAAATREARRAARLVPPPADVYEVGCGAGELLLALQRRGFRASGIELSVAAARAARARGLAVEEGGFVGGRGIAGGYDLVIGAHVLEHVPDPRRFLEDLRRILRPGGLALLKMPLAGGLDQLVFGGHSGGFDVPYHFFVPSRAALASLVAASGLVLERIQADTVPNDWIHGLRKLGRAELGIPLPFLRPWNALLALPLWPVSSLSALLGAPGRVRVLVRKPA